MRIDLAVLEHYLRDEVQREVSKFCRGRWVALEARPIQGKRVFYRYFDGRPLRIDEPADVKKMINRFGEKGVRTIYGTLNIYGRISSREDLEKIENVLKTTPSIDVDGSLEEIDLIIESVRTVLNELHRHGADRSVYLVWSGRGVHLHLNEKAINERYWKHNPVRVAHSIVHYILTEAKEELLKVVARSRSREKKLKIENIVDMQRVFTSPLSIHRELDIVTVTINPDEVENFDIGWTRLGDFRYWRDWDQYVEGELDHLVEKALENVKTDSITRMILGNNVGGGPAGGGSLKRLSAPGEGSIGRFQVMALMQAARYYLLRGDLERAKSFGLNRAIFYAWAKKRGLTSRRALSVPSSIRGEKMDKEEVIGDEVVYKSSRGWYMIGGQEQTPRDFDEQVVKRFGGRERFEKYWEAALRYIQRFPLDVVESQKEFYEKIYLPVRDDIGKIFLER